MTNMVHTPYHRIRRFAIGSPLFLVAATASLAPLPVQAAQTFTVSSAADSPDTNPGDGQCISVAGGCTLRAAIQESNAKKFSDSGVDTIYIPAGTATITLTITGRGEDSAATGDLDITDSVNIIGNYGGTAGGHSIINANGIDRVFHIASGTSVVKLSGLQIVGGATTEENGAGVLISAGTVTITDCLIQSNTVTGSTADFFTTVGGGIHVGPSGTLVLENSTLSSNAALAGGGLSNQGKTNIRKGTFITNNDVTVGGTKEGGGGGVANLGGFLNIGQVTIDKNIANLGGGVYNSPQGNNNGTLNISGATIDQNVARQIGATRIGGFGAGIYNLAPMSLQQSTVSNNYTRDINNANVGADGGGIYNSSLGNIDIVNTTISSNAARSGGGLLTTRNITLTNATVFNNKATPETCTPGVGSCEERAIIGGNEMGVYNANKGSLANEPDVVITNTILADGPFSNGATTVCSGSSADATTNPATPAYTAYITSNGYNIGGDNSCSHPQTDADKGGLIAASDRIMTTAQLLIDSALQFNTAPGLSQDPTKTHQLLANSPAIDSGSSSVCPALDQRNMVRDSKCDIGAYEYGATASASNYVDLKTTVTDSSDPSAVGAQLTYTVTITNLYETNSANNVVVTVQLPSQVQLIKAPTITPQGSCSILPNTVITCSISTIGPQESYQIFLATTPIATGFATITATADVKGSPADAFLTNNTGSQVTEILGSTSSITTNFSPTTGGGGGTIGALLWIAAAGWSWRRCSRNKTND